MGPNMLTVCLEPMENKGNENKILKKSYGLEREWEENKKVNHVLSTVQFHHTFLNNLNGRTPLRKWEDSNF